VKLKHLFLILVLFLVIGQDLTLAEPANPRIDEIKVYTNEMMNPDAAQNNPVTGVTTRYGTLSQPGAANIIRWCVNAENPANFMKISPEAAASGAYGMEFGMGDIPSNNLWLDMRRVDAAPGWDFPLDASGTERVTFWIKADSGTAPLWFMAESFKPSEPPVIDAGLQQRQYSVNAFIDGETVIIMDEFGEAKLLRDNHFNGEWQLVSLPWEFLTMTDSATVAEVLPWSLVWEGSMKDSEHGLSAFDQTRIRTIKWHTKPESDALIQQYWKSEKNLWGAAGVKAAPGKWMIDEVLFTRHNNWHYSQTEINLWTNEMMNPDEGQNNPVTGVTTRYGANSAPAAENVVRWCVNAENAANYMQISSENPAEGPYCMKFGMGDIPSNNLWMDIRRVDAAPGWDYPLDASQTGRVTFWIKAKPGTAPLWFMGESYKPSEPPVVNANLQQRQYSVNAFIDGETVVYVDEFDEVKKLRDNHWNDAWQFVSLPWEFLMLQDSAEVAEILPWSLVWEGSLKDSEGGQSAFDYSRIRTIKWHTKPESDALIQQYWNSENNLWGAPGVKAAPGEWEIDEVRMVPQNTVAAYGKEIALYTNEMMDPDPAQNNPVTGVTTRYGQLSAPGAQNIIRWCVNAENPANFMKISQEAAASGAYGMEFGMGDIPSNNLWMDLRRVDAAPGWDFPLDASQTDRVSFWIKADSGTAPLWFMAESFKPSEPPVVNSGLQQRQYSVNAFIDGETVMLVDEFGEVKVLRDNHWNSQWQFVSLPWAFLTLLDSALVAELLPYSLVWEGSLKDSEGSQSAFDQSRIRTIKWHTKPENDALMNQYWNSENNLWGAAGVKAAPGKWMIDEVYFTSAYTPYYDGKSGVENGSKLLPVVYELKNAYPNPFNPVTNIQFAIPVSNSVKIEIYNIMGQKIRTLVDDHKMAGTYTVSWNARNDFGNSVSSGIYFVRMQSSHFVATQKISLLK